MPQYYAVHLKDVWDNPWPALRGPIEGGDDPFAIYVHVLKHDSSRREWIESGQETEMRAEIHSGDSDITYYSPDEPYGCHVYHDTVAEDAVFIGTEETAVMAAIGRFVTGALRKPPSAKPAPRI